METQGRTQWKSHQQSSAGSNADYQRDDLSEQGKAGLLLRC